MASQPYKVRWFADKTFLGFWTDWHWGHQFPRQCPGHLWSRKVSCLCQLRLCKILSNTSAAWVCQDSFSNPGAGTPRICQELSHSEVYLSTCICKVPRDGHNMRKRKLLSSDTWSMSDQVSRDVTSVTSLTCLRSSWLATDRTRFIPSHLKGPRSMCSVFIVLEKCQKHFIEDMSRHVCRKFVRHEPPPLLLLRQCGFNC